jgi:RNA polymerase sigma-70 factor (ECF subfamily)
MSAAPTARTSAELLYERYSRQVHGFCRARLPTREEAEDAVQHTFLNAHRSLRTGTVPRAEAAWLFAIAANVCRERLRSAWRRSRVEVVSDDGLVGDRPAPEERHDELSGMADALAALTPNQRRAILLREWQGLSYREIAAELSLTEAAVETLLFRARRSLARKLDRSRAWSWSNLGSALAWGKTLLGGTAVQVAAATLVVSAGVTAAAPSTHRVPLQLDAAPVQRMAATPVTFVPKRTPAVTTVRPPSHNAKAVVRTAPRTTHRATPSTATPALPQARASAPASTSAPAPAPVQQAAPAPVSPAGPPAPPAVPQVPEPPPVEAPPLPVVPPLPPLPPVTDPALPNVDLPSLPLGP